MNKTLRTCLRVALLPAAIVAHSPVVWSQASVTKPVMATPDSKAPHNSDSQYMRASQLIGKNVHGANNKNIGEINDMVIDVATGDVRYVMFEYDPSIFKTGKVYAVPLKELTLSGDGKSLGYQGVNRQQLDRVATEKKDWKQALANTRYLDSVDSVYGVKSDAASQKLQRASDLIGRDVRSRAGKDIGEIKELIVDLQTSKVRYAVLAFDPSIFSAEKMFAFPMTAFKPGREKDELMLDVDRQRLDAMKSFDKNTWTNATDIRSIEVNNAP